MKTVCSSRLPVTRRMMDKILTTLHPAIRIEYERGYTYGYAVFNGPTLLEPNMTAGECYCLLRGLQATPYVDPHAKEPK